jgi:uncharacterized OsmC-like protein
VARVVGEVELEDKVLVVRRIHVRFELKATPEQREVAERVHGFFAMSCPLYRTLRSAIAISTELVLAPG